MSLTQYTPIFGDSYTDDTVSACLIAIYCVIIVIFCMYKEYRKSQAHNKLLETKRLQEVTSKLHEFSKLEFELLTHQLNDKILVDKRNQELKQKKLEDKRQQELDAKRKQELEDERKQELEYLRKEWQKEIDDKRCQDIVT